MAHGMQGVSRVTGGADEVATSCVRFGRSELVREALLQPVDERRLPNRLANKLAPTGFVGCLWCFPTTSVPFTF